MNFHNNQHDERLAVSFDTASAMVGISRAKLYQMHNSGALGPQPQKIGSRSLLVTSELRLWCELHFPARAEFQQVLKDGIGVNHE